MRCGLLALAMIASTSPWAGAWPSELEGSTAEETSVRVADAVDDLLGLSPSETLWRLAWLDDLAVANESVPITNPPWLTAAPLTLRPVLSKLWSGIVLARQRVDDAFGALTDEELEDLLPLTLQAAHAIDDDNRGRADDADREVAHAWAGVVGRVDREKLLQAGLAAARVVEGALPLAQGLVLPPALPAPACATGPVLFETGDCLVVVGGSGANTYRRDTVVNLDFGGNDVYHNNAGGGSLFDVAGAWPTSFVASIAVDLGEGNDVYDGTDTLVGASQGVGCAGVGVLLDSGGSDHYAEPPVGCVGSELFFVSQGSAAAGVGVLWDRCSAGSCADTYSAHRFAQAVTLSGAGLLIDEGGADVYELGGEGYGYGQGVAAAGLAAVVDGG
ncbi:MAG TPA: hypothetical protein VGR28_14400, partial [Candidatus Thermoplasmatota archaeon]|nr:hypothetical protein [Candidatus Thermoplasmatota archaeon]